MTRYEYYKSLSLEEMADELCRQFGINCDNCPAEKYCYRKHNGMKHWLMRDIDERTGEDETLKFTDIFHEEKC